MNADAVFVVKSGSDRTETLGIVRRGVRGRKRALAPDKTGEVARKNRTAALRIVLRRQSCPDFYAVSVFFGI